MPEKKIEGIKVCVFDAYGTLFDVHSAGTQCRDDLGDKADQVSNTWRNKQLQYSCLRQSLKSAGKHTGILSNGSREMLDSAVENSSLGDLLDPSLSVVDVGVFKVDSRVYKMATDRFDCSPPEICFMSSNAWDAWAASHFGFQVAWVNRFGQPPEHMPGGPAAEITTLEELPPLLGL